MAVLIFLSFSINAKETNYSIKSETLAAEFTYSVTYPYQYHEQSDRKYPLLLVLDGQNYGDVVSANASFMSHAGDIPEHVIISLTVTGRLKNYTPTDSQDWFGDGGGPEFLSFINEELMTKLNSDFRLNGNNVLWGHSAAGLFTMYALLENSPHFKAFLVNDGSLDWDKQYIYKQLTQYLKNTITKQTFLYLNSSYFNPNVPEEIKYMPPLIKALEDVKHKNLRWAYQSLMNESHSSIPMLGFIDGIRELYRGYRVPEDVLTTDIEHLQEYVTKHMHQIGAQQEIPEYAIEGLAMNQVFSTPIKAVTTLQLGLNIYPDSLPMREMLADAFVNLEQFNNAKKVIDEAIAIAKLSDPEYTQIFEQKLEDITKNNKQKH